MKANAVQTPTDDTISVIVPALNEGENLRFTVGEILEAVERNFKDYEIIIINDRSTDATGSIADSLAAQNSRVHVVHNEHRKGLGGNFRLGVEMARMTYITLVNGKHDIAASELRKIFSLRGCADLIVPYHTNGNERPLFRQIVSRTYTAILNLLFGYHFHYYNDSVLHRRDRLRLIKLGTNSYAFAAEALIKSLRSGCSHVEVPIKNLYPRGIKTKAFHLVNIFGVMKCLAAMVCEIYFLRNHWHV